MTDKTLIHLNKNISNIETNQNNLIKYNLKNPIKLNTGDTITLYQSFINERGLSGDTFSLQEDYKFSLRYLYYIEGGAQFTSYYTVKGKDKDGHDTDIRQWIHEYKNLSLEYFKGVTNGVLVADDVYIDDPTDYRDCLYSCVETGGYYVMFRIFWDDIEQKIQLLPQIGTYEFTIPKGNYSPSSLAQFITDNMNGLNSGDNSTFYLRRMKELNATFWNDNYAHPLTQKIDFTTNFFLPLEDYIGDSLHSYFKEPYYDDTNKIFDDNSIHPFNFFNRVKSDLIASVGTSNQSWNKFPLFINCKTAKRMIDDFFNTGNPPYWEDYSQPITGPLNREDDRTILGLFPEGGAFYPVPIQALTSTYYSGLENESFTGNVATCESSRTLGCKEFSMIYEAGSKNRFSFSNLHTPLKLPSHNEAGLPNQGLEGQQILKINKLNYYVQDSERPTTNFFNGHIPKHSSGGIMVISFIDDVLKKYDKKFNTYYNALNNEDGTQKDLDKIDKSILSLMCSNSGDLMAFDEYDNDEFWAKYFTENSIWARLGFTYEQIFKIQDNLTEYPLYQDGDYTKTLGLITFNEENLSTQEGLSLTGASPVANSVPINTFDGAGTMNGNDWQRTRDPFNTVNPYVSGICPTLYFLNITTSSRFISAQFLPDLMGNNNYFIIESDIIKNNYIDALGNYNSVIGVISLENSNQDTLFSTVGIDFTLLEQKILSSITIRVSNPDGSNIPNNIINQNSAFIFIIQKNIQSYLNLLDNTKKIKN